VIKMILLMPKFRPLITKKQMPKFSHFGPNMWPEVPIMIGLRDESGTQLYCMIYIVEIYQYNNNNRKKKI
jgi:hypothetical protein